MSRKINFDSPPLRIARRLVAEVSGAKLASGLIAGYAREFDRLDVIAHPERRSELEIIIHREILLAAAARITLGLKERAYDGRSGRRKASRASSKSRALSRWNSGTFTRELAAAVARESGWTLGDAIEFQSDLEIYRTQLRTAAAPRLSSGRAHSAPGHGSPFVDRCAILLDPSMLENARRAAAKLCVQVESLADKIMHDCLMPGK